jgi:hypothetical protein
MPNQTIQLNNAVKNNEQDSVPRIAKTAKRHPKKKKKTNTQMLEGSNDCFFRSLLRHIVIPPNLYGGECNLPLFLTSAVKMTSIFALNHSLKC